MQTRDGTIRERVKHNPDPTSTGVLIRPHRLAENTFGFHLIGGKAETKPTNPPMAKTQSPARLDPWVGSFCRSFPQAECSRSSQFWFPVAKRRSKLARWSVSCACFSLDPTFDRRLQAASVAFRSSVRLLRFPAPSFVPRGVVWSPRYANDKRATRKPTHTVRSRSFGERKHSLPPSATVSALLLLLSVNCGRTPRVQTQECGTRLLSHRSHRHRPLRAVVTQDKRRVIDPTGTQCDY